MPAVQVIRPRPVTAVLVLLAVAALVVPSGVSPAGADRTYADFKERRDAVAVGEASCEVISRYYRYTDGTVDLITIATGSSDDYETCFYGATEAKVRYTYRDADGDLQSGEVVGPGSVTVTLPFGDGTELRSLHSVRWADGTQSADYPLPK